MRLLHNSIAILQVVPRNEGAYIYNMSAALQHLASFRAQVPENGLFPKESYVSQT